MSSNETSVYMPVGVDLDAARSVVAKVVAAAIAPTYRAWAVEDDPAGGPGCEVTVDLLSLPAGRVQQVAEAVRDALRQELGVDARTELEMDELV